MLPSWFTNKHDIKEPDGAQDTIAGPSASVELTATADPISGEDDKYPKRATTTAISTPHDAVLAELQSTYPGINFSAKIEDQTIPQLPTGLESQGPPFDDLFEPTHEERTYAPEELRDPFNGASLGMIGLGSNQRGLTEFSLSNQDMWTHLSKVLELQSEIAKLHIDMEGITAKGGASKGRGTASNRGTKTSWDLDDVKATDFVKDSQPGKAGAKLSGVEADVDGDVGDMDVGEEDEEALKKKAREEEFANLANKFEGRKAKVDAIMDKLSDLSKSLTEFHALQTPAIAFPSSSSRQASTPMAPPIELAQKTQSPPHPREVGNTHLTVSTDQDRAMQPRERLNSGEKGPIISKKPVLSELPTARHPPGIADSPKSMGSFLGQAE